jgi:hypothetical protein
MINKFLVLTALVCLTTCLLPGQAIHYDYDETGNRTKRYIVLGKGNSSDEETSKKDEESSKEVEENTKTKEFEENLGEMTIKIYPNPTRGQLVVKISGLEPDETVDYQLFSNTGLLLDTKGKNNYEFKVDMARYSGGMYVLRLMIKGKISQWKILKE